MLQTAKDDLTIELTPEFVSELKTLLSEEKSKLNSIRKCLKDAITQCEVLEQQIDEGIKSTDASLQRVSNLEAKANAIKM